MKYPTRVRLPDRGYPCVTSCHDRLPTPPASALPALHALPEDHEALRGGGPRALRRQSRPARGRGRTRAATFPKHVATTRCVAGDFHAPHVPEEYGGAGADALATCIVIEEVARVVRVVLADPGGEQARHDAAAARRVGRTLKQALPAAGGPRRGDVLLRAERAGGRQRHRLDDAAGPPRTATAGVLSGQKSWITNAGVSEYYTVLAVTDPDGPRGRQRHRVRRRAVGRGLHLRCAGAQARDQGQPDPRTALRRLPDPRRPGGRRGRRARVCSSRCARSTTPG